MKYKGKLWGKVGNEYFPLQETSEDVDKMKAKLKELEQENKKLYWQLMDGREFLMEAENINNATIISETLEAFGFGRNGLNLP